jgi:hypothetical protein
MNHEEFFAIYGDVQLQFAGFVHAPPFTINELFEAFLGRLENEPLVNESLVEKARRGRPKGSKNKSKDGAIETDASTEEDETVDQEADSDEQDASDTESA